MAVGAIIGAGLSILGAGANALFSSRKNKQIKDYLKAEEAEARSQETADRYGDWKYSGANLYFNKAADEVKDYVRQQRAARRVTGVQGTGAEEAAGKAIAQAAGQAQAQRQAVGLELAQQDRARRQALQDQQVKVDMAQSKAMTDAMGQVVQAGAGLAASFDGNGKSNNNGGTGTVTGGPDEMPAKAPAQTQVDAGVTDVVSPLEYGIEYDPNIMKETIRKAKATGGV